MPASDVITSASADQHALKITIRSGVYLNTCAGGADKNC